jgi:hypothetical protein
MESRFKLYVFILFATVLLNHTGCGGAGSPGPIPNPAPAPNEWTWKGGSNAVNQAGDGGQTPRFLVLSPPYTWLKLTSGATVLSARCGSQRFADARPCWASSAGAYAARRPA